MHSFKLPRISFKRITSSSFYLPQVDGLRIIPLILVIVYHISLFIVAYSPYGAQYGKNQNFIDLFNGHIGRRGVLLFFVISGFILALPFARQYINKERKISLSSYYLRRLTRLEPPYIVMLCLQIIFLLLIGGRGIVEILKSFLLSLFYLHNFFPDYLWLNQVTWSLEVEVQFYLLAPIICLIYLFKYRKLTIIFNIIIFSYLAKLYDNDILTIVEFLPFFLLGLLLADFYVGNFKLTLPNWLEVYLGGALLVIICFANSFNVVSDLILMLLIFLFYGLVIWGNFWKKVFSIKWLVAIGGMCYSLYLMHPLILHFLGFTLLKLKFSSLFFYFIFQTLLILILVIFGSALFYLMIERPCMDKHWPQKLTSYLINQFKSFRFKVGFGR